MWMMLGAEKMQSRCHKTSDDNRLFSLNVAFERSIVGAHGARIEQKQRTNLHSSHHCNAIMCRFAFDSAHR